MIGGTKNKEKKLLYIGMFVLVVAGGMREAKGYTITQLTFEPSYEGEPAWSQDGNKIAFVSDRDGNYEIYVMDANGSNQERLTYNIYSDRTPAWSPDGNTIAFTSSRDGTSEIYLMESNGSNQRRVTDSYEIFDPPLFTVTYSTSPAWSPDGSKIAFEVGAQFVEDAVSDLYILDISDDTIRQFTHGPYSCTMGEACTDRYPSWSPDGDKIVFVSHKPGGGIKVKNVEDSDPNNPGYTVLQPAYLCDVEWSPTGDFFSFSTGGSNIDIFMLPADRQTGIPTREPIWLTYGINPSWSPNGTKIAFDNPWHMPNSDIWLISGIRILRADLQHDGIVNLLDFGVLADCWRQDNQLADFAPDGGDDIVDFIDIAKLCEEWLQTEEWYQP